MSKKARPSLEYYQEVLGKISFVDRITFRKELRKAFKRLLPEERKELKRWFRATCLCRVEQEGEMVAVRLKAKG